MSASQDRQFVDTNVLVYAHDASAGTKHERAKSLLTEFWHKGTGCLSVQVLQEFYVTVTQKVARPLAAELASQIIRDLACWRVHVPEPVDILQAIELHTLFKISFWDAMILHSARTLGCRIVWSEDLNPGQNYGDMKVLNPFS